MYYVLFTAFKVLVMLTLTILCSFKSYVLSFIGTDTTVIKLHVNMGGGTGL